MIYLSGGSPYGAGPVLLCIRNSCCLPGNIREEILSASAAQHDLICKDVFLQSGKLERNILSLK